MVQLPVLLSDQFNPAVLTTGREVVMAVESHINSPYLECGGVVTVGGSNYTGTLLIVVGRYEPGVV